MWMVTQLLILSALLLGWLLFGTLLTTGIAGRFRRNDAPPLPEAYPAITVIVPIHNAERTIAGKIRNLMACDYPRGHLEILLVEGRSTDATLPRMVRALRRGWPIRLFQMKTADRAAQINHALSVARGEVIVVTDADTRLRPDALKWLVAHLSHEATCDVVGAYHVIQPECSRDGSRASLQSRLRRIESDAGHCTSVSRACYAFRRSLSTVLPEDARADELYISLQAISRRRRVRMSRLAVAESVNPRHSFAGLTSQIFRDHLATLRERTRLLHRTTEMSFAARLFVLTHLARSILLFPLFGGYVALAVACATMGDCGTACVSAAALAISAILAYRFIGQAAIPSGAGRKNTRWLRADVLAALFAGTIASGVWYWFAGSRSSRRAVGSALEKTQESSWPDATIVQAETIPEAFVRRLDPLIAAITTSSRRQTPGGLTAGRLTTKLPRPHSCTIRLTPSGSL